VVLGLLVEPLVIQQPKEAQVAEVEAESLLETYMRLVEMAEAEIVGTSHRQLVREELLEAEMVLLDITLRLHFTLADQAQEAVETAQEVVVKEEPEAGLEVAVGVVAVEQMGSELEEKAEMVLVDSSQSLNGDL